MDNADLIRHLGDMMHLGERVTTVECRIETIEKMCAERYEQITTTLLKMDESIGKSTDAVNKLALAMAENSGKGIAIFHVVSGGIAIASVLVALYVGIVVKGH
jgi:hypothetical protein